MAKPIPIADRLEWWPRNQVRINPRNVRRHGDAQLDQLADSMRKVWTFPCLVHEDADRPHYGEILAGHARFEAALRAGYTDQVKVLVAENWTQAQIDAYVLFDNQIGLLADWDEDALVDELRRIRDQHGVGVLGGLGWDSDALDAYLNPVPAVVPVTGSLAAAFGVPPFSVLNTREGWWQKRKASWLGLGIQSEIGRADKVEAAPQPRSRRKP